MAKRQPLRGGGLVYVFDLHACTDILEESHHWFIMDTLKKAQQELADGGVDCIISTHIDETDEVH